MKAKPVTPTFDRDGYPSQFTLDVISGFDDSMRWKEFIHFLACSFSDYGRVTLKGFMLEFRTGGWSGNEDVIGAFRQNFIFHSMMWESSHRGGRHVYDLRQMAKMVAKEKMQA